MFTNDYIDGLLASKSEENLSGDNIEYDPGFLALEAMLPETTTSMIDGAEIQTTDWRAVRSAAEDLLGRSLHLPSAVILTAALVETASISGLRDGLCLIDNMLDRFWDDFWPRLDPEDPDLLERENALSSLSPAIGAYSDPIAITQRLRDATILQGRQAGILTLRCITDGPDREKNEADASIVLPDADPEDTNAAFEALTQCLEAITSIEATLTSHTDDIVRVDFSVLQQELNEIHSVLANFLGQPTLDDDETAGENHREDRGLGSTIENRSDIVEMLDRINSWYELNEPGSPIPLLVNQIRSMVNMRFSELMAEIYPDAVQGSRLMVSKPDEE